MTGAEAARKLRVAQSQVSRWRRGEGGLSEASMRRISEVFGTDIDYLKEITGTTYAGPSVYRADSIDPYINVRLDAIRSRMRELLEGIPPNLWVTYLEATGSMLEFLAKAYVPPEPPAPVPTPESPPASPAPRARRGGRRRTQITSMA